MPSYAQKYHSAPAATMAHCRRTLAGFLTPPQTYELCQTAKAFHVKENGVPRATRALRVSLERSLARVLKARGVCRRPSISRRSSTERAGRARSSPGRRWSNASWARCGRVMSTEARDDLTKRQALRLSRLWTLANGRTLTLYYKDKIDVDVFTTARRRQQCGRGSAAGA